MLENAKLSIENATDFEASTLSRVVHLPHVTLLYEYTCVVNM